MANLYADAFPGSVSIDGLQYDIKAVFTKTFTGGAVIGNGDVLYLAKLPKGAIVTNWWLDVPSLDGDAANALELGRSGNAAVDNAGNVLAAPAPSCYLGSNTVAQAGGFKIGTADGGHLSLNQTLLADDNLIMTFITGSTVPGQGSVILQGWIEYNMRGEAF